MRRCGVGQSDAAGLESICSSVDYSVDTGLSFELSQHGDEVHVTITCNPRSTVVGYIPMYRDIVAYVIQTLDGHDNWRFMVAASALFHSVSRLSSVRDGVSTQAEIIRRSTTSLMCYGSPFDGQCVSPFASLAHDLDWVFESLRDARSLVFQCLRAKCVHDNTCGLGMSIPTCLVQDEGHTTLGTIHTLSLSHGMLTVNMVDGARTYV